jgi:hypothetical protein
VPFNYPAQRLRADRMIARYGSTTAKLRRGSSDRTCTAVEIAFTPRERRQLTNPTDRRILISSENLPTPPDQQLDKLVVIDPVTGLEQELKIVEPVGRLAPSFSTAVFWDLMVRG